jgi:hypothetical protein
VPTTVLKAAFASCLFLPIACASPTVREPPRAQDDPWGVSTSLDGRTFTVRSARIAPTPKGDAVLALGDHEEGCTWSTSPEGRTLVLTLPWTPVPSEIAENARHTLFSTHDGHVVARSARVTGTALVEGVEPRPGGTVRVRLELEVDGIRLVGDLVALRCADG